MNTRAEHASEPGARRLRTLPREASRLPPVESRVALVASAALVVLSPQLIAGANSLSMLMITVLAALYAGVVVFCLRHSSLWNARVPLGVLLLFLPLLWTWCQQLPLPVALTRLLAPAAVDNANGTALALRSELPSWVAVTLAPAETWREVIKGCALACAFCAAFVLARLGLRRRLLSWVVWSVVAVAVVTAAHQIFRAEELWGIYRPIHSDQRFISPLLNPNHLGAYLAFGVPLAMGLAVHRHLREPLWWLVAAFLALGTLLVGSRGAAGSLALGVTFFIVLWSARKLGRRGKKGLRLTTAATLAGAVGLALLTAAAGAWLTDRLTNQDPELDLAKLEVIRTSLAIVEQHPWLGVGRGAFSSAFVSFTGSVERFEFPESLLVQWASEWGVPVTLGIAVLMSYLLWNALRGAASALRIGGAAAVLSLAGHDMVDFSLEMLGIAIPAAVVLATLLAPVGGARGRSGRVSRGNGGGARWLPSLGPVLLASTLTTALVLGWSLFAGPVLERHSAEARLRDALEQDDRERFRGELESLARAYPAEPTVAILAGAEATRHRDPEALRWLNRAMILAPNWSAPHLIAADWMGQQGRIASALLELREASLRPPADLRPVLCPLSSRLVAARAEAPTSLEGGNGAQLPASLRPLVKTGDAEQARDVLDQLLRCPGIPARFADQVDRWLLEKDPSHTQARIRVARRSLAGGKPGGALEAIHGVEATAHPAVARLRAEALIELGRAPEAVAILQSEIEGQPRSEALWRSQAQAAVAAGDMALLDRAEQELRALSQGSPKRLAAQLVFLGSLKEQAQRPEEAMKNYSEADRFDQGSDALRHMARLAENQSQPLSAYRAYSELCARNGFEGRSCRRRDALRGSLNALDRFGNPLETVLAPSGD